MKPGIPNSSLNLNSTSTKKSQLSQHPAFYVSQKEEDRLNIQLEKRQAKAHKRAPQSKKRKILHREAKETSIHENQDERFSEEEEEYNIFLSAVEKKENAKNLLEDPTYEPFVHQSRQKGSQNILDLMGAGSSPVPQAIVSGQITPVRKKAQSRKNLATALLSPSNCESSTPNQSNPSTLYSPVGKSAYPKSREIIINGTTVAIYLPEEKIGNNKLFVPSVPADTLDSLSINQASLDALIDVPVTLAKLQAVEAQKQADIESKLDVRYPSQKSVMGVSPNVAATQAGLDLPQAAELVGMNIAKPWVMHWCHYIPHSLIGNDGQKVTNLGLGTKFCNAEMTLVEPVIEVLLKMSDAPDTLYISVEPQYCAGYEKIKLLDRLTYTVKDGAGSDFNHSVSFSFDARSLNRICKSEQEIVKNLLIDVFKQDKHTASTQATQRFDLLTPKKPLVTGSDDAIVTSLLSPLLFSGRHRQAPGSPYQAQPTRKPEPIPFPSFTTDTEKRDDEKPTFKNLNF